MDPKSKQQPAGGLYVRGVVVSSAAHAFQRKDGSGTVVKVQHELATQPGVVLFEQYHDPKEDTAIKVEGDKVTAYPQLPLFKSVALRINRYRLSQDRLVVTSGEEVDSESVPS